MKNRILIVCLLTILSFIGFNIYSIINKTITAKSNFNLVKEEYNKFKSESTSYNYNDIINFSKKYNGIRLKSIKNAKDSITANFYFEGSLEALDIFLKDICEISNLKGLNNIILEKENNISYKGEIASEFIVKFN